MRTVLIIGGGFCGVACAVQLLRAGQAVRVLLLERGAPGGLAYARCGAGHLLNVPAGRMSAFADDAENFLRFARERMPHAAAPDYLPRRLYAAYLAALLDGAVRAGLERVAGQAVALLRHGAGLRAVLADGRELHADRAVLASGHFAPCDPPLADMSFYADSRYQRDPWDAARLASVHPAEPVLLLGSGLTAADVALSLLARGAQRITMLSRHGFLPQGHCSLPGGPSPAGAPAAAGAATVRAALRAFRAQDWRNAMAALRPHTEAIWQAWPDKERRRFLRHLQPYWDSHRHRLPPEAGEPLQRALRDRRLRVLAGRLLACEGGAERIRVALQRRGAGVEELQVARVINCTGSCPSPDRCADPLIVQLLDAGALRALPLGAEVAAPWAGELRYVGPWLKAGHWEATAVPELRHFAAQAAAWALT